MSVLEIIWIQQRRLGKKTLIHFEIMLVSSAESMKTLYEELHRNFAEITSRAINIISDLAENH
jgi:hypothetical protein